MNDSDFIGFSFNGVHSDTLHIKRVSDGSRYNDTLSPNFQDVKAQVPGRDGTLYWDSFYSEKQFPVQVAFDELSESGLRTLRQTFNGKVEGWLIFDETPYKQYWVKVQNPPQFKYLCFYDENNERVYKGEGTINFVAYDVYAHGVKHFTGEFTLASYPNRAEWSAAAGMAWDSNRVDGAIPTQYDRTSSSEYVYPVAFVNVGDKEMDWVANIPITDPSIRSIFVTKAVDPSNNIVGQIVLDSITKLSSRDNYLIIDSATELIQGCNWVNYTTRRKYKFDYTLTGTLYNQFISSGNFFKIPVSARDSEGNIEDEFLFYALSTTEFTTDTSYLVVNPTPSNDIYGTNVFYDYIYY